MILFVNRYFEHKDDRGSIQGLINKGDWQELNLITSESGILRGNHYHKKTRELFIILEGEIEIHTQQVIDDNLKGKVSIDMVKTGDVFLVEPMINHIFLPKSFSTWLNALSEPLDQENPDMYRVATNHV
jgi:dTDP-4-dehydrorhamnose 3,5-epimerase-like enzyme